MRNPVVVTRPRTQADALAQRIAALGREAIVFPLLEIHPLADNTLLQVALDQLNRYAMVAFVSPNAIDAVFSLVQVWPKEVALAVMGESSRRTLANYGITPETATIFSPHDATRTDSQTLLAALNLDALQGRQMLIVRGETGRELLADALREAGIAVTQVAGYRRVAPTLTAECRRQLLSLLDAQNDWIMTSSEALGILLRMVEQSAGDEGVAKIQQKKLIVPHVRIAEVAQTIGFRDITLTGSGDESLLGALQLSA
jgi:uroporphyrinogen-III synthase